MGKDQGQEETEADQAARDRAVEALEYVLFRGQDGEEVETEALKARAVEALECLLFPEQDEVDLETLAEKRGAVEDVEHSAESTDPRSARSNASSGVLRIPPGNSLSTPDQDVEFLDPGAANEKLTTDFVASIIDFHVDTRAFSPPPDDLEYLEASAASLTRLSSLSALPATG